MRRVILLVGLGLYLAACTPEQEAKWQSLVNAVNNGVRVTTEAARQMLDEVCAQQPIVISAAQSAITIAQLRGDGPKTRAAIRNINAGIVGYTAACQGGTADVSLAQLAVRAWNAYQAIRTAQAQAQAAGGA